MKRQPIMLDTEDARQRVTALIAGLNLTKPWQVTVEPYVKRRSLSQNSLMHKWLDEVVRHVGQHTGQDHDDIHEFFKAKFLTPKIVELNGETQRYYTTTNLTVPQMSEHMDKIYAWVTSELGLLLPLPAELHQ